MTKIKIGDMALKSKNHKVTEKGDEWWLTFKDKDKNTLKVNVEESVFDQYEPKDALNFHDEIEVQSRLG